MTTITVNDQIGGQSVSRTLRMRADNKPLPPHPEGYEPGGSYEETESTTPDGKTQRWLWYGAGDGNRALLGQVPATAGR